MGEVGPVGFHVGGTGAWVFASGTGSLPFDGQGTSGGVFCGVYGLSTTLGSLSSDRWVCVPVLLVV